MIEGTGHKTVAIHQPNYIPWLGYFHKMAQSNIFVYLDAVQYPRGQSFSPRNRIKTPNGVIFVTIPVQIPGGKSGKVRYTEVRCADDKWKNKHLKTIEMSYKRSPFFKEIFELYRSELTKPVGFTDLNIGLIENFADYLGINTKRARLSDLLPSFRQKTELIVDICKVLEADTYLSGTGGGRDYNDEETLRKSGIELIYNEFNHPKYPQLWGEFEPGLSILDVLFNCGPQSREFLS